MSGSYAGAFNGAGMPVHGGQIRQVMQHFPEAPAPFIDLSTGISPYPYPVVLPGIEALARLPQEHEEDALLKAASRAYGVPSADMIVAAPGTQMLISLLPHFLDLRDVTIFGPTYSGHETSWHQAGARVRIVTDSGSFRAATGKPGQVCILCNPNNPDGRLLSSGEVQQLAERCAASGSFLIVDEAFADVSACSVIGALPISNVLVLRSFGKSYGLPGVRLGFLIATPSVAGAVRHLMGSWPVGTLALEAGTQALSDETWLRNTSIQLQKDRARLDELLAGAGLQSEGKSPLFTLIRTPRAQKLWRFLCKRGIVTRAFADRPADIRLGLPHGEEEWERLAAALREWEPA